MSDLENKKNPVVITIARDFGAEGHEIGRMLADELGIPLYDNELLVRASLRAGESLDKMAAYDERLAVENMAFLPDRYAKLVKQQQKAREAFYKRYSAGKWKMTSGKDIVVNRAKLGREGCKDVIAAAYRYKVAQLED